MAEPIDFGFSVCIVPSDQKYTIYCLPTVGVTGKKEQIAGIACRLQQIIMQDLITNMGICTWEQASTFSLFHAHIGLDY